MTDRIVAPHQRRHVAALALLGAGLGLVVGLLTFQAGHDLTIVAAFVIHALVAAFVAVQVWQRRRQGWVAGIVWFGLSIWTQFWVLTFSDGDISGTQLGMLNALMALTIITWGYHFEIRRYFWPAFVDTLTPERRALGKGVIAVALVVAVLVPGIAYDVNWRLMGNLVLSGVGLGSLYALAAIGFVLVYKVTDVLNFAQGIFVVVGAFSVVILVDAGLPLPAVIATVIVFAVLLGIALERLVFRHFIGEPELSVVLVTLAFISLFGGIVQGIVGGRRFRGYPDAMLIESISLPFGFSIRGSFALGIVTSIVLLVLLNAFFRYTVLGVGLRAAASDQKAAMVLGVSIPQATTIAWTMSILITMIGGILLAMSLGGATFAFETVIILVFAAAIFGGLDSIGGAFVGSLVVGVLESFGGYYYAQIYGSGFDLVLPMLFLLAVIVVKPYGIWGTERIERI